MNYVIKLFLLVVGVYFIAHAVSSVDGSFWQGFAGGFTIAIKVFLDELALNRN